MKTNIVLGKLFQLMNDIKVEKQEIMYVKEENDAVLARFEEFHRLLHVFRDKLTGKEGEQGPPCSEIGNMPPCYTFNTVSQEIFKILQLFNSVKPKECITESQDLLLLDRFEKNLGIYAHLFLVSFYTSFSDKRLTTGFLGEIYKGPDASFYEEKLTIMNFFFSINLRRLREKIQSLEYKDDGTENYGFILYDKQELLQIPTIIHAVLFGYQKWCVKDPEKQFSLGCDDFFKCYMAFQLKLFDFIEDCYKIMLENKLYCSENLKKFQTLSSILIKSFFRLTSCHKLDYYDGNFENKVLERMKQACIHAH